MSIRVAINGFGRIGRLAFRKVFGDPTFEGRKQSMDLTKPGDAWISVEV